jgi:hypothetical protein
MRPDSDSSDAPQPMSVLLLRDLYFFFFRFAAMRMRNALSRMKPAAST